MSENTPGRILVRRPARTANGSSGNGSVDHDGASLELVSTQMLKVILTSKSGADLGAIESIASSAGDGVLARDPDNGGYEIISDEELATIIDTEENLPHLALPADATIGPLHDYADSGRVSLVSTRALRRVFEPDNS